MPNLMEVTLRTEYFSQQCINRWTYVTSSTPSAVSLSFALASAMGFVVSGPATSFPNGTLANNMRVNVVSSVLYREVTVRDVYSNTDFYTTPIVSTIVGGVVSGEASSPTLAYGFKTNRTRTDISRAYKRFVGVAETDVGSGGVITSGRATGLNDLASAMTANLTYTDEGSPIIFSPCVVKKFPYETPSGRTAYRYAEVPEVQLANIMTGIIWQPYGTVRTQTSRQYGRGI